MSVPAARRFVTDGLTAWGEFDVLDVARLCISELCANAALHAGGSFMEIVMQRLPDAIRLAVVDEGAGPLDDMHAQAQVNSRRVRDLAPGDEPTTGRGLFLVQALAKAWGVATTSRGKLVWADVSAADDVVVPRPAVTAAEFPAGEPPQMPGDWRTVRLLDCPVELSLRQDQHLDELIRELQLIDANDDSTPPADLAALMSGLLASHAHARHTGRRAALQAQAVGLDLVTVEMPALLSIADDVQALNAAVNAADELCTELRLLTLAAPPEVRRLRQWMTQTIVTQVEHGEPPIAFADWRAAQG